MAAELIEEIPECQQIRETEEGPPLTDDEFRIRDREIRPLRWHRADGGSIDSQQKTSASAVAPLADARQRPPTERVERMRDPHKTLRGERNICILD